MTIVRMMAHQWFGNLVTPIWWDYAWLSEGFSTYFEYFTTAKVKIIIFDTTAVFHILILCKI